MTQHPQPPRLVDLQPSAEAPARAIAKAQNFTVERLCGGSATPFPIASETELIILLPRTGARLSGAREAELPGQAIAIVPPGTYTLTVPEAGEVFVLATDSTVAGEVPDDHHTGHDPRIRAVGRPYQRVARRGEVRIHPVASIPIPPDNGRLRFVQSETMSLNWVEYDGVRDRSALSPHAHTDFEQASLAIEGAFIHHLRTPWGRNADLWQEDQHLVAGPASVMIIPPEIVHTTEGSGGGRHVLVDVFAPPRDDFIARGWVFNADEYVALAPVAA
ncbi:conserved hypothetical protein [Altererythrobacter sp. B11]|uniref:hypothetical protein n=1 Tax=Altererythrobacter sp. B11 TaxID=2060312 RepID=UPI000DC70FFD|nr:hypothetical protein [Altererythrobacter sp. B11]BBC71011.1 conserved hypothetical protein [Altererythrobacter sp. B11]